MVSSQAFTISGLLPLFMKSTALDFYFGAENLTPESRLRLGLVYQVLGVLFLGIAGVMVCLLLLLFLLPLSHLHACLLLRAVPG